MFLVDVVLFEWFKRNLASNMYFDFFHFWQMVFLGTLLGFFSGGAKNSKNCFQPFSRLLRRFLTTLIFLIFDKKSLGSLFYFWATPKFTFTICHLVRHNWMYTQNFRALRPFLHGNSTLWHTQKNIESEKLMGQKKCWVRKNVESEFFVGPNKFWFLK